MRTRPLRKNAGFGCRKALLRYLISRDGQRCAECGAYMWTQEMEVHHKLPLGEGGADVVWNMQILCNSCHEDKHEQPNEQAP